MLVKSQGLIETKGKDVDIYIGSIGDEGFLKAQAVGFELRKSGICVEYDTLKRSVKAQLKYANKINAKFSVVIGENEIKTDCVNLKNMTESKQEEIKLSSLKEELFKRLGSASEN